MVAASGLGGMALPCTGNKLESQCTRGSVSSAKTGSIPTSMLQGSRLSKSDTVPTYKRMSLCQYSSRVVTAMALEGKGASTAVSDAQQWPSPQTIEEAIQQASGAVQRALASGRKRQRLQLLLPVDQRQFNYLDTEPRDYPCGIGEEYAVCAKMVGRILKAMTPTAERVEQRRIGERDNEMDPVGLVYPSDKSIAAVVFPIAETLKEVRSLASNEESRPLLIVNPQWRSAGQVVSDFGFGPWKRQAEEFVDTFENTYTLLEQRVGEASNVTSSSGGVIRILKCFPGDWQVFLMSSDGNAEVIGVYPYQPTYKELEKLVCEARKRIPWRAAPRILGGSEPAPPPLPRSLSGALSDDQIEAMDVQEIRRTLMALKLPSSGRLATVKVRLKEAQKKMRS